MFESELLTQGFSTLLNNPQALLFATFGVMLGIVIGALPGLTATMGVAILLPFTYGMEPVSGLLMICGVFFWWRLRWFYHRNFAQKFPEHLPPQPPLLMVMS
nr:tripartite tricarboxylate transporter permease [Escherichia coli]